MTIRYLRRHRFISYRTKRWRRAVASHSKFARANPAGFSRYIDNEDQIPHTERKETILPCGYTVAESWAALRKSWLGFKIAHGNSDIIRTRDYASIITKLQVEMGIPTTNFDTNILDEEEATNIKTQSLEADASWDDSSEGETEDPETEYDDELPDYELMINRPSTTPVGPEPREEIFAPYHKQQKSCAWVRHTEEDEENNEKESEDEIATPSGNSDQDDLDYSYANSRDAAERVSQTRRSCYYPRGGREHKSCYYKRKG